MTKDEALKLARRALYFAHDDGYSNELSHEAITAIKAALEAKDEPVAWLHTKIEGVAVPHRPSDLNKHPERWEALYKTPQRTWVGLTDEERNDCLVEADPCECLATPEAEELMRTVEAKLKEKNT